MHAHGWRRGCSGKKRKGGGIGSVRQHMHSSRGRWTSSVCEHLAIRALASLCKHETCGLGHVEAGCTARAVASNSTHVLSVYESRAMAQAKPKSLSQQRELNYFCRIREVGEGQRVGAQAAASKPRTGKAQSKKDWQ
eukprot:6191600-Pleurochrysis_carterae.AAC.1